MTIIPTKSLGQSFLNNSDCFLVVSFSLFQFFLFAKMICIFLVFISVIFNCMEPTNGQCTVANCKNSVAESDESAARKCSEYEQRLQTVYKDISSRLQEIQSTDHILARNWKEQDQRLQNIFANVSSRLHDIGEIPDNANKCLDEILENKRMIQEKSSSEFMKIRERQEEAVANLTNQFDQNFQKIFQNLSTRFERIEGMFNELKEKFQRGFEEIDQKMQIISQNLSIKGDENLKTLVQQLKSKDYCHNRTEVCDCSDIKASGFTTNEVYRVYVIVANRRHYANAYCDMTTANNSWLVFQRRKDGSEDFYRRWNDYANGFGDPNDEFWLGNEFLHLLTSKRRYRLRIDLEDFEGETRYAEYPGFNVQSSDNNYTLTIGNYAGNAGDSMAAHNNQQFSTFDHGGNNCAQIFHGAWWYRNCHDSNLNGKYLKGNHSSYADGINWKNWRGYYYSLKTTEMKIAPLN